MGKCVAVMLSEEKVIGSVHQSALPPSLICNIRVDFLPSIAVIMQGRMLSRCLFQLKTKDSFSLVAEAKYVRLNNHLAEFDG